MTKICSCAGLKNCPSLIFMKYTLFIFSLALLIPFSALAAQDFDLWLQNLRTEAYKQGISQKTVDAALGSIRPIPRVVELDRKQPEGRLTFAQYKTRVISKDRIAKGRRLYREHKALLDRVSAQYGVQPQYIVALWGIETSYGGNTGGFAVIPALATLAYDGRRSAFFRKELINALKIIDAGHIQSHKMKGSWAGAMGQNQFMPSSFNAYAVDGNHDGRRDIWGSLPDVFASTANYLAKSGWRDGERWGRRVALPAGFSKNLEGLKIQKSVNQWARLGVTLPGGRALPQANIQASIVAPDGLSGPIYMVYNNYRTIMRWNKSTYFATSVGLLADSIGQ